MFFLKLNRSVISISNIDKESFLQGLITNNIKRVGKKKAIYSMMLNHQGRFLYDFFIIQNKDEILLDCNESELDEIINKFSIYKLRSKIDIKKTSYKIFALFNPSSDCSYQADDNEIIFDDPRNIKLGKRLFVKEENVNNLEFKEGLFSKYEEIRIQLKIPCDRDLIKNKSFPAEYGLDKFAIDYNKGCYIGQEFTTRTHFQGVVRKKIYLIKFDKLKTIDNFTEIKVENKKIGIVLSSIINSSSRLIALALLKTEEVKKLNSFYFDTSMNDFITII